jgi:hypothetical protein
MTNTPNTQDTPKDHDKWSYDDLAEKAGRTAHAIYTVTVGEVMAGLIGETTLEELKVLEEMIKRRRTELVVDEFIGIVENRLTEKGYLDPSNPDNVSRVKDFLGMTDAELAS